MSNRTDNHILIERLKNDNATELMPNDLNEMLEQELSKSAEEMDTQLVRDLLDLLEEEKPSQKSKDECWEAIRMHVQEKNRGRRISLLRRISAAAAALIVVFFISLETAKAFNWSFLLKFLEPVAQTFGIYSANNLVNHVDEDEAHEYVDEETEYEQLNYAKLEDMPVQLKGCKIVPDWIPERYTFAAGSIYEDENVAIASIFFNGSDEFLSLSISVYKNDEDASAYVYEAYTKDEHLMQVEDQSVTYYHNDSGQIQASSAITDNVHVYIGGNITEYELEQIIASMN